MSWENGPLPRPLWSVQGPHTKKRLRLEMSDKLAAAPEGEPLLVETEIAGGWHYVTAVKQDAGELWSLVPPGHMGACRPLRWARLLEDDPS